MFAMETFSKVRSLRAERMRAQVVSKWTPKKQYTHDLQPHPIHPNFATNPPESPPSMVELLITVKFIYNLARERGTYEG